jgi:adenylosuccinate lyase
MSDELLAISPLDGRYAHSVESLSDFFSEFAYIRDRTKLEVLYLIALSDDAHLIRRLKPAELDFLQSINNSFNLEDARQIKEFEISSRHDVKAIESYIRKKISPTSLADLSEYIHFGLTSEDVNNLAQSLELRNSRDSVILPVLDKILEHLAGFIRAYKSTPMLARTHGQPAVPTTFGKEIAVYYARLRKQRELLKAFIFEAKLNGAVGNFNAGVSASSEVDWLAFSEGFIRGLQLEPNIFTNQILPYDNWVQYFNILKLVNSILLDLVRDMWQYISLGYLKLKVIRSEVGSSTMPQKVNPIDFENAEGNLGLANSLFDHYATKLPISRLQRDLSDSTVRRTFGTAIGHTFVAFISLVHGLENIEPDGSAMSKDLNAHWEVITEGVQTILRAAGVDQAYDLLKSFVRGKDLTKELFTRWVDELDVDGSVKEKLHTLTPLTYIGLAEKIADRALADESIQRKKSSKHEEPL